MQSRSSAPASSGPITELQLLPPVLRVELERYSYLLSVGPSQHTRTHLLFRPLPVCLCPPYEATTHDPCPLRFNSSSCPLQNSCLRCCQIPSTIRPHHAEFHPPTLETFSGSP